MIFLPIHEAIVKCCVISHVHLRSLDNFTCEDGWFWCFQADKTWNKRKEYNGREAIALRSRTLNEPFLCKKTDPWLLSEKNSGDAIRIYEGNDVRTCTRDHSSITSSKRWVGRVRKWQFLIDQRGGEGNKNKVFSTKLGY